MVRKLLLFILLSLISFSAIAQDRPRQAPYVAGSIVHVIGGCKTEDDLRKLSTAASVSIDALREVGKGIDCGTLRNPHPAILLRKLYEFKDYEADMLEAWEAHLAPPYSDIIYTWFLVPGDRANRL